MARKEREFEASDRMSEHEALMWNVEKDPWLNASGASLTLLDKPADFEYLRRALRAAVPPPGIIPPPPRIILALKIIRSTHCPTPSPH